MRIIYTAAILLFLVYIPDGALEKKIDKMLKRSFQPGQIEKVLLYHDDAFDNKPEPGLLLYEVRVDQNFRGYLIATTAKGRYDYFDYAVIYDADLSILAVEVLEYRSEHGYEIANKKWLSQFIGNRDSELVYGEHIDALSGATYSASSLTDGINKAGSFLREMKAAGKLN